MPGFSPAAEFVAWRVPKGAPFVVEEKDPKPLTSRPTLLHSVDASYGRADQLAVLKQGPPVRLSVHPWGRGGRRRLEGRGEYRDLLYCVF